MDEGWGKLKEGNAGLKSLRESLCCPTTTQNQDGIHWTRRDHSEVLRVDQKSQGAPPVVSSWFMASWVVNAALFIPVVTSMSFCLFCYISWKFLDYLH